MVAHRFFLFISFVVVVCATAHSDFVLHERRDALPKGFVNRGPAAKDSTLNLRIALTSNNLAGLEKALYDVSTPSSALYGQHLSKDEVTSISVDAL
jgi:tripeptidyl-peptidase-1